MANRVFAFALLSSALVAQSPEIYSNGPVQTGIGTQGPISVLQSLAPNLLTVFGFGAQAAVPNRMSDQFAVNTLMILDGISVLGYTTGATTVSVTDLRLSLYDGDPSTGTPNQLLVGAGNTVNLMPGVPGYTVPTAAFTGVYRVLDTAAGLPLTNRNIVEVRVNFTTPLTLLPGIYHLQASYTGLNFMPPTTTLNKKVTGDSKQAQGAGPTWVAAVSGPAPGFGQGMPFKLYGTPTTAPGAITNLAGGCSTATFDVQGSPAVGGYVYGELGNVNAAAFGAIVVGFNNPNTPLFVCACVSHASSDYIQVGAGLGAGVTFELDIPANAGLVGADIFLQGAQIDIAGFGGIAACNLGVQFDLTAGFQVHLY